MCLDDPFGSLLTDIHEMNSSSSANNLGDKLRIEKSTRNR